MSVLEAYLQSSEFAFSEEFYNVFFKDYPISDDDVEDFISLVDDFSDSIERSKLKPYLTVLYHLYWLKHGHLSFLAQMNHLYLLLENNSKEHVNSWFAESGVLVDLNKYISKVSSAFDLLSDDVVHVQSSEQIGGQSSNNIEASFLDDSDDDDVDLEELLSRT
ncbi:MAG: hypothetical protein CMK64_05255 [Pseudoalteromonas sp.]|nr:hypothetical protein [Pseudoalteromonas sp.]|tara:strand:- start:56045 stop:56533 length:489 start_codon:yes stop_codon:yes gene_type:complete